LNRSRLLVCASIVLLCLVVGAGAEKAARTFPAVMLPQWQIRHFVLASAATFKVVPDRDMGFVMPPNQRDIVRTVDYTFLNETDGRGFPNREPWPQYPDVVLLGDSLVMGNGVGLDLGFAQLAARQVGIQLVDLGVPGAGLERQYAIYHRLGQQLGGHLVVTCLFLASDFENDQHFVAWQRTARTADYNRFRIDLANAQAARKSSYLDRWLGRSWLYGMGKRILMRAIGRFDYPDRYESADGVVTLLDPSVDAFAAEPANSDDPRIHALMASVEKLRAEVRDHGAKLLVVLIPSKEELFGVPDSIRIVNVVARAKAQLLRNDFQVLDLYPALRRVGRARAVYFMHDIHLNAAGNRVAANEMSQWLRGHLAVAAR
jgi:hypothetical protein